MKFLILILVLAFVFTSAFVSLSDGNHDVHPEEIDYDTDYQAGLTFGTLIQPYIELFGQPEHSDVQVCTGGDKLHYHVIFGWFVRDSDLPPYSFNLKVEFVYWPEEGEDKSIPERKGDLPQEEFIRDKTRI